MQIRFLEYLLALAQERHFARAARRCNVSQPTLSSGLAALEQQVGKRLVERDRRFQGLTPEGLAILPWAQQIVAAHDGLSAAISATQGQLAGMLRLGAIPAAMPAVGLLASAITTANPGLEVSVRSQSSRDIVRGLAAHELDAGLTYVDHEAPTGVIAVPLYRERPIFLIAADRAGDFGDAVTLAEALAQPLCLLHQDMQNRRILDEHFARHGLTAAPLATADTYEALIAMVGSGGFNSLIPDSYGLLVPPWARALPIMPALAPTRVGLVVSDRQPLSPIAEAALKAARAMSLPAPFDSADL
ncbi:LysR family transcriptional regulator [Sphingomonas nostoxanthinifaciens]|uniref:LysR family transcriptional regulator n=1 Tax=Sphingomonas nostoxanthinifaciens TaxID=2872652 RepID=UPI001CC1D8AD|nr:LysR family transcriptional regulator [Sphingomonas nostoxanthinifaciens]UAK25894.1 LysR family transcriptional regulator [Sphingomonas nostoxanthinifaciens]